MPKVKRSNKPPPEGWELVQETLENLQKLMRKEETEDTQNKSKQSTNWGIFRLHHQRTRYVYEMYHKRKVIQKPLYDYLLKQGYADGNLIAKWKKQGYEKLCCLRVIRRNKCIQPRDTNFQTTCICRVPSGHLKEGKVVECLLCGYL